MNPAEKLLTLLAACILGWCVVAVFVIGCIQVVRWVA